jgi:hypothetical protein
MSQRTILPAGNLVGAYNAPTARITVRVLEMSCDAAAGLVGETTVVVVLPQVIVNTYPVCVSADALLAPIASMPIASKSACTVLRMPEGLERAGHTEASVLI